MRQRHRQREKDSEVETSTDREKDSEAKTSTERER